MNLQSYIESGELELYVFGQLDEASKARVESYRRAYPEIEREIQEIELALEQVSVVKSSFMAPVPTSVLDGALSQIDAPAISSQPVPDTIDEKADPLDDARSGGIGVWMAVSLLALTVAGLVYSLVLLDQRQNNLDELSGQLIELQDDCATRATNLQAANRRLALVAAPATQNVILSGTENAPDSRAVVFHNPASQATLFSAANLPAPPTGKQYQLWAINDNGPQSLGVLDRDLDPESILELPFVPNAGAFAITLEDEGGKPEPDLSQLQVIGEVG